MRLIFSGRKIYPVILAGILAAAIFSLSLCFRAVSAFVEGIRVPILMYHSVGYNNRIHSSYLVSPEVFESDLRWLKVHGYTSVSVSDLTAYVTRNVPLPEKPVVITLDDGFYNNLTYVLPVLEKLDMRATVSLVGEYCEHSARFPDPNPAYAYLSWDDVSALCESGRIELGNHTYEMHHLDGRRGCLRKDGEDRELYHTILTADLTRLQEELRDHCGITPTVFAYPYGSVCSEALPILKQYFSAALTCEEKCNLLSPSRPADLWNLGRFNRPAGERTEDFFVRILNE